MSDLFVIYTGSWVPNPASSSHENIVTFTRRVSFNRELEEEELNSFLIMLGIEPNVPIDRDAELNVLHIVDSKNYVFYVDLDLNEYR